MEALTRLCLVRAPARASIYEQEPLPPAPGPLHGSAGAGTRAIAPEAHDGPDEAGRILAALAARPLDLVVSSPEARALQLATALAHSRGLALHVDARLAPRERAPRRRDGPREPDAGWGSRRVDGADDASSAESLQAVTARVIAAADRIAREHPRREIALVLHFDGARALLARAVGLEHGLPLELEPGAIAVLDWAHPEAREFQHSLVAVALDRDLAPPPTQAHRYPGGASVLPGPR